MENIILYSTGCPKCKVLEKKLEERAIKYKTCTSEEVMRSLMITKLPVLSVAGTNMDFATAINWLKGETDG